MSRCDISIRYDQPDRTYRGGDTVSGEVHVEVNKDTTSNGIQLTHYWKTHGYGNTDSGDDQIEMLAGDSELRAGEDLSFPFSFVAECQPLTYRGHHINVDHYVKVAVDVPWAIDPKSEEEFILLPGKRPPEVTGQRDEVVVFSSKSRQLPPGCLKALYVFLAVTFFWLAPVVLLVLGASWAKKKILASRLGKVTLQTPHRVVGVGEDWPLELQFTPKKNLQINGIEVKIRCRESATSGSGTNATVRKHTVHEKTHVLESAGELTAGELFDQRYGVPFPETGAYSLNEGSNKIEWTVEIRVDIVAFPDWKSKQTVQVLAAEFLDEVATEDDHPDSLRQSTDAEWSFPISVVAAPAVESPATAAAPTPATPDVADVPVVSETEQPVTTSAPSPEVLELIQKLSAADRFGSEREDLIATWSHRELAVVVNVDRVTTTFGSTLDDAYQNGQTIQGTVAGTDQAIEVLTRSANSLEDLSRGDQWRCRVMFSKWDSLYNRLVALEVASG
ncbi:MAG: hypothetical protein QF363_15590 [Planctomycetaceae bacterium]|jgi:hypothetical protein|nr:hypothetical protein [Planctomycetaceae bacterium]